MGAEDLERAARDAGREAEESTMLDHAVRVGLVSYGVVHLLLAWLVLQLALGSRSADVSTSGALHELAGDALGRVLLVVLAAGFAALVLWQLLDALVGHRSEEHTSELQSRGHIVCRLLLEKKKERTRRLQNS